MRRQHKMLKKSHKIVLGTVLLLLVDLIWVSTSKATKFLYKNDYYEKPFLCTYFKTSMFTLYLVLIGVIAPWKDSCERNGNYLVVDQSIDDEHPFRNHHNLGDSSFIPIRVDTTSSTESDDSSIRSVRFNKMAEVREMSSYDAPEAIMSRLSYTASLRIRRQKTHNKTARTALIVSVLWFLANYLFQLSLQLSETVMVTVMSSSCSFFTLLLAAVFPSGTSDKFTISKLIAVFINISGVVFVSVNNDSDLKFSRGAALALMSAFIYSSYLIFVKKNSDTEDKIDIVLFFGFVGLWNLLLMWPIFFILNLLQIETFELPNERQFIVLLLNGLLGTVISEALWLWGCFLTSSLLGTLALTLQIPLSMIVDFLLKDKSFTYIFYFGSIPIFFANIFIAFLLQYEDADPLLRFCKIIYRKMCNCPRTSLIRIPDLEEQRESLIDNHEN